MENKLNLKVHPLDECVFFDLEREIYICIYVDDLFISTKDTETMDEVTNILRETYKEITVKEGEVLHYLGMVLDFSVQEQLLISMPKHINELLTSLNVQGSSRLPADADLFKADANGVAALSAEEKDGFRSVVASLLYISKRARPDVLLPVQYLSTRVSCPTAIDKAKLVKVLKYLNGSKDYSLCLKPDSSFAIKVYIDASFGIHGDGKGQTGAFITLGKGPTFVKSSKQRLVGKSSTEAELIAVSDVLSNVLWFSDFLKYLGIYQKQPIHICQDNVSTIAILNKGIANGCRTKHINVRYNFIKDYISKGVITFVYTHTKLMIADIFTKPLTGPLFVYLRRLLLAQEH